MVLLGFEFRLRWSTLNEGDQLLFTFNALGRATSLDQEANRFMAGSGVVGRSQKNRNGDAVEKSTHAASSWTIADTDIIAVRGKGSPPGRYSGT